MKAQIIKLQNSNIRIEVEKRLKEFSSFAKKSNDEWFSELCFCILTANSKAVTGIKIQQELGANGFLNKSEKEICKVIQDNKHRFHNNKSSYIVQAREFKNIKNLVKKSKDTLSIRNWIAENIKGIGYKEASHFLRNIGKKDIAILDRHILNLFKEYGLINEKPKTLTKKIYLEIEKIFLDLAEKLKMNGAELDLYMWYLKTNKILK
ncbi:N-glycosylase/DNA lyase [Candidatus Woesearchaeota archaeon]|nr:N-glycosylase/DNA lyase [Candidatus Woesearchaeota archaeon]